MVTNEEREQRYATVRKDRYADAIYDRAVDHAMWIGDDGKPLDYLPARETRLADFVYEAAAAVVAVADAEQAELRATNHSLREDVIKQLGAMLADERAEVERLRTERDESRAAKEIWRASASKWKPRAEAAEETLAAVRAALDGDA